MCVMFRNMPEVVFLARLLTPKVLKQKKKLAILSGIFIKWYFEQIPAFGHRALDPDLVKTGSVTMTKIHSNETYYFSS